MHQVAGLRGVFLLCLVVQTKQPNFFAYMAAWVPSVVLSDAQTLTASVMVAV